MNTVKSLQFMACVACAFLTGCAGQQYEPVEQLSVANLEKRRAMEIAEDVLCRMHFTIEKADTESGFIRTRPLSGAQFFELWRSDNVGPKNSAEANLHSIRRIVELHISRQGGSSRSAGSQKLYIECDAQVQRLNLPEHQVSSSARAYEMFSKSSASMQKFKLNPEQREGMAWVNLGKDTKLATEILKRIEERLKRE